MDQNIVKCIQLIFICNKNEDITLYNECLENLKDRDLYPIADGLRKLRVQVDNDNKIGENEIKKLDSLFELTNLESYEYEQTMGILFESIELIDEKKKMSNIVMHKLYSYLKYYNSENNKHVSFSSLYLLLFYIYKKEYKNKKGSFEEKNKLEYLDDEPVSNPNIDSTINEWTLIKYLNLF